MQRSIYFGVLWMAFVMQSSLVLVCAQQAATTPRAPVPSQIISARKVFISNAGGEEIDPKVFFLPDMDNNRAYDKFYAAVKSGGHYEPVPSPADADLVLEIRFSFELLPGAYNAAGDAGGPHLRLVVLDPKTNVLLWALSRQVAASSGPHGKEKRETNFDQAMAALLADLTTLGSQPAAPAGAAHK
jgi:hypothetical protein